MKLIYYGIPGFILWNLKLNIEILNLVGNGKENIEFWLDNGDNVIFIDSKTKTIELGKNLPIKSFDVFIKETWNNKYKRNLESDFR
ncbi:MAG: hypothetical protein ACFFAK_16715 [Promethearchaeota archaeon]